MIPEVRREVTIGLAKRLERCLREVPFGPHGPCVEALAKATFERVPR